MRNEYSTSKREVQNDSGSHFPNSKSKRIIIAIECLFTFPKMEMKRNKRNQGNYIITT
jgi:hypothetical protein